MEKLTEILFAQLSIDRPDERISFLVDKINDIIKPPRQPTSDNVNIRVMYVLNDLVNSHGGRFRRDDLAKISELILDTPVLIGHYRTGPPLARTFHAELEERGNILWLKSYFYWPKTPDGKTDELLEKIDSGVLKECSISFVYSMPECSECGGDMRNCPHDIDLISGGNSDKPHFIYSGITQVLETSLVCKGSVKGTYVTDKLSSLPLYSVTVEMNGNRTEIPLPGDMAGLSGAIIMPIKPSPEHLPIIVSNTPGIVTSIAIKNGHAFLLAKSV